MNLRRLAIVLPALWIVPGDASPGERQEYLSIPPDVIAQRMTDAHGGMSGWEQLETVTVDRVHQFTGRDMPFVFQISGELGTRRIYQAWQEPPGEIAWNGKSAWSIDWSPHERLKPRFVTSIGFYLINLPWLIHDPVVEILGVNVESGLPPDVDREFIVLSIQLEADSVRKPADFEGERDHFDLFIDPESYLLQGVRQFRTYAGQLDAARAPAEVNHIAETYVPGNYVDVMGLQWPGSYNVYSLDGELAAQGRFFNYEFNSTFDESRMRLPDDGSAVIDESSSYLREGGATP